MTLDTLRKSLRETIGEANKISSEFSTGEKQMDEGTSNKLSELIEKGEALKLQIKNQERLDSINGFANDSADASLPLAGTQLNTGATLHGSYQSGHQLIERGEKGFRSLDADGEGFIDAKTLHAISQPEYKSAFRLYLRQGKNALNDIQLKTLQEGVDGAGGYLVPEDMLNVLISKMISPMRVASRVTTLNTSRDALTVPKVNYTADDIYTTGIRATWTGEIPSTATVHRVTDPVFGMVRIPVHTAMLSMPVTNDMIEDAMFPLVSWSTEKFSETIDILKDNMILNGTGIGQPAGILLNPGTTNQPAIVVSGNASLLTPDGLIDLAFSLPEQYDEKAAFILNKTNTALAISKLKDSNNRYLFGFGLQDSGLSVDIKGRPLLGYDTVLSALMPNIAANAFPVIFGDARGYYLVNRIGFSIQVLRELYAETNQILLLGRIRFGGVVAEPWKLKIQKVSV